MKKCHIKKTALQSIKLLLVGAIILFIAGSGYGANLDVQTGFNVDYWADNQDSSAVQTHIPVEITYSRSNYSLGLLTGYANTHVGLAHKGKHSFAHVLDTKVNFTYDISKGLPFGLLFGLDINLPTGKTGLEQKELQFIMDPDLVSISSLGEGYNVNPTLSAAKEWGALVAGAGVGYLWRGEYDFSETVKDYDPGDISNTSAEVRYFFSPVWNGRVFGNYVWYGKDRVRGDDFYQEGDYYQMGLGVNYARTNWLAGLTVRGIFREKSSSLDTGGGLSTEGSKSRGDEWAGDLTVSYQVDDETTLKSFIQGLHVSKNGYSAEETRFVGRREKYTIGIGASKEFTKQVEAGATLKGFTMRDAEANFPETKSGRHYLGASFIVNLTSRFSGI
ncbi:MAG: hypothetical protein AB1499_08380 [Nitrospirota bacterium]